MTQSELKNGVSPTTADSQSEQDRPTFYITTPIYYPSDKLHIGHSYTTVAADAMARYKRLRGYDVMFLTGTDEHGQKIQSKAQEAGVAPQVFVDRIVATIKDLWELMDISYDRFIRTTDDYHEAAVQAIFQKLYDKGDIYLGEYEGWYCTPCESFWTESQLEDGVCPDCGREVEKSKESSYFFRLSKYQDRIIQLYKDSPEFIQPKTRANEMLNNFLLPGLEDLAVSRSSFDWGVRVPFDQDHVIYVWIDALVNYITALGFPGDSGPDSDFARYWPADVQLIGKEIVRFHTIIWPAILMALDLPMPKQVFGHGWLLIGDGKMSKSVGNVVDPVKLCERYGVDAIRYFLLREVPFGSDGNFDNKALVTRINSDLANDLGNLLSRTTAMISKYFDGVLPEDKEAGDHDDELAEQARVSAANVAKLMDQMEFSQVLAEIWKLIGRSNKYIDETTPWLLAKDESQKVRLGTVLYNLAECLRIVAILIEPFMPNTPKAIREALCIPADDSSQVDWDSTGKFGSWQPTAAVQAVKPLFPRIDIKKEIAELNELQAKVEAEQETATSKEESVESQVETIKFDDFLKVNMVVGQVKSCEKVEGSDKLLCFQMDLGSEERQIVSGIADTYEPADLVGRKLIVVTNLAPRKIFGKESQGMLLAGTDKATGKPYVLTVDGDLAPGSEVS